MRFLTATLGLGLLLNMSCSTQPAPPQSPNILFIMADDHAEQAISAYGGNLIQTPNLDRLAREGMRFENSFVTNSICAPSRAVMLTGKYSHRNGLRDNRDEFDGSQMTFPKLLQAAGYQTAIVGKWHLKTDPTGFDHWEVLIDQGDYYSPVLKSTAGEKTYTGRYTTELITDLAIEVLEKRDRSKPFSLLVHHKAPHRNWMPDTRHLDLLQEDLPLPETFWDDYSNRSAAAREADMRVADMYLSLDMKLQPGFYEKETGTGGNKNSNPEAGWKASYNRMTEEQKEAWDVHYGPINEEFKKANLSGRELTEWKYQRYIKDYLRCILSVDENVGRLLDYLDENGLTDNTLVVYTSDQGFYLGEHGWYDKRFMYEESLSMPLLVRYPAVVPANQVNRDLVLNLDFAPTFLDMAGVEIPADMQGISLRPLLSGASPTQWRDSIYYHYYEYPHGWHDVKKHYGVRTQRYKLIHFYDDIDAWELFDLETDPNELHSLYDDPAYAETVGQLTEELRRLQELYGDETR